MTKLRTHPVEDRLQRLYTIKEKDNLQTKAAVWKRKANIKEANIPAENDFRTQISATVKMQKDADLLAAVPEWNFIPLDGEGRKSRKVQKYIWDYHWLRSNTDKALSQVIQQATTYGTGVLYEQIKHIYKTVKEPKYEVDENGNPINIIFEDSEKLIYSGIYTRKVPFENFFINGSDIDEATEAIVITHYDKDAYISEKENDPSYVNISKVKATGKYHLPIDGTVGEEDKDERLDNIVTELEYYNIAKDEYIVIANGIEIKRTPNPYPHKQLPFCLYIDNYAEDRIYGIGEFELTEQEERTKNEIRSLLVKSVKFSIGMILKDRNTDIEEDELLTGIGEVYETSDINGIKQLTFQTPVGAISELESKIDNDIISKTGIDFKGLYIDSSETATRTGAKQQSSKKRTNKNIKDNAFDFYRRLADLRFSNIRFIHSVGNIEIPIEGGSINADGILNKEVGGGYGSAIITKELVKGTFLILPIVETLLGNSKARRRDDAIQYAQLTGNIVGEDGKPVIKGIQMAQLITEEFDYDFEKLTEQSETVKSPKDILNQYKQQTEGTQNTEFDPNYVPPEQRNIRTQVPTISGRAVNLPE